MTRDQIIESALQLPPEDRAFVASALEHSIGSVNPADIPDQLEETSPDALSGQAMLDELNRRMAAHYSDPTTARPAADVIADLRRKQAAERRNENPR